MKNDNFIFNIGKVESNIDDQGGDRIIVRVNENKTLNSKDLVPAFPLLPKHIYIKPQQGEKVIVIGTDIDHMFYIGPIVSQLDKLLKEDDLSVNSFWNEAVVNPDINPLQFRNSDGVYPKSNDLALLGKNNTDIIHKDNEIWIRAGKFIIQNGNQIFSQSPTFIKIKSLENPSYYDNNGENISYKNTMTLVSDEINLISTSKNAKNFFNTKNPEEMITEESMQEILEKAHKLPYGEILVEILNKFIKTFLNHFHNGMGTSFPIAANDLITELSTYNENRLTNELLSNNIRIN